jgi:ribose/xylose/arabinose/galactoside ABC-type transport system permease subunit
MAAIARERAGIGVTLTHFIALTLGVVILLGYSVLPWVNQPDIGATTVAELTAGRDSNPLGVPTSGVALIPMAAIAALALGAWNALNPRAGRTISLMTVLAGLVALVYYIIFFRESAASEMDFLGMMGPGFWLVLVAGILMIVQFAIPRESVRGFEISRMLGSQEIVLALALIILVIGVGIANPRFLAERNLSDVLQGHAYIAVAAIGVSMVIISGNIDISAGALIGVLAIVNGTLVVNGFPIWFAWLAPLVLGGLVGAFIGFLVAYLRIPAIIVTLGMMSILKGGLIFFTEGTRVTGMPQEWALSQMRPLGIPMPVYIMIVLTIIAALWMRYSQTGRAIYAVGGNAEAARLSGISRRGIIMRVFIINGVIVGVASVLFATQLSVIQATVPSGLELLIITASVVGGVSILGGTGTVIGSTLAAILLNTIRSAMIFINISAFWLQAVQGLLILITVLADLIRRRRQML